MAVVGVKNPTKELANARWVLRHAKEEDRTAGQKAWRTLFEEDRKQFMQTFLKLEALLASRKPAPVLVIEMPEELQEAVRHEIRLCGALVDAFADTVEEIADEYPRISNAAGGRGDDTNMLFVMFALRNALVALRNAIADGALSVDEPEKVPFSSEEFRQVVLEEQRKAADERVKAIGEKWLDKDGALVSEVNAAVEHREALTDKLIRAHERNGH